MLEGYTYEAYVEANSDNGHKLETRDEFEARLERMHYLNDWRAYEARWKAKIPWADLDANIVPLIKALNDIPGCITEACCGGHTNGSGSCPAGEFIVGMMFTQDDVGWNAFWQVSDAVNTYLPGKPRTSLDKHCLMESDCGGSAGTNRLTFWLHGKGTRDELVQSLEYHASEEGQAETAREAKEEGTEPYEHRIDDLFEMIMDEECAG